VKMCLEGTDTNVGTYTFVTCGSLHTFTCGSLHTLVLTQSGCLYTSVLTHRQFGKGCSMFGLSLSHARALSLAHTHNELGC
jgi:hypothetical protein